MLMSGTSKLKKKKKIENREKEGEKRIWKILILSTLSGNEYFIKPNLRWLQQLLPYVHQYKCWNKNQNYLQKPRKVCYSVSMSGWWKSLFIVWILLQF